MTMEVHQYPQIKQQSSGEFMTNSYFEIAASILSFATLKLPVMPNKKHIPN